MLLRQAVLSFQSVCPNYTIRIAVWVVVFTFSISPQEWKSRWFLQRDHPQRDSGHSGLLHNLRSLWERVSLPSRWNEMRHNETGAAWIVIPDQLVGATQREDWRCNPVMTFVCIRLQPGSHEEPGYELSVCKCSWCDELVYLHRKTVAAFLEDCQFVKTWILILDCQKKIKWLSVSDSDWRGFTSQQQNLQPGPLYGVTEGTRLSSSSSDQEWN